MSPEELTLELRLDWSEMDLFGHINNVAYFKFLQSSRVNCWEKTGLSVWFEKHLLGPTLASTACTFKKPLHYPGTISIRPVISFLKTTSFGIHHNILNHEGELCATGEDVVVFYDYNQNKKATIPDEMRTVLDSLLR